MVLDLPGIFQRFLGLISGNCRQKLRRHYTSVCNMQQPSCLEASLLSETNLGVQKDTRLRAARAKPK
jgi:hypothetical protein